MEFGLHFLETELSKKRFKNEIERYDWCEKQMQIVITDILKDKEIAASEADNKFLEDLDEKVWINPKLKEHQEVEQFVCGFISKALHKLQEKNLDFDLKLIKSGSYYSNHRVGRPYEFDYLLEIPNDNVILRDQTGRENIFFDAGLRADTNNWPYVDSCHWGIDSEPDDVLVYILQDFKEHLFTFLFDCINTVKKDYDGVEILKHECYGDNVPPALTLEIYYKDKNISVDLVPCFKYPYHMKTYKDYIPPAKKRLWEFLNRALSDKSPVIGDGPLETNLEGINKYLYRETLEGEMVGHICNSSGCSSRNCCKNDSNSQTTETVVTSNDDNQRLDKASPSLIGVENKNEAADFKWWAEGMESEISFEAEIPNCAELKIAEKSEEQNTLPMKSNEIDQSTTSVKTNKYDQADSFFKDNLYLVIADKTSMGHLGETFSRLSTSLVENFIFSKLDDQLVKSLRIVKYFLQTFHIAIRDQEHIDRVEEMGVPSIFPSRWITVIFLNLVLESDLFRTKLNLTQRVAYLLSSLVTEGYDSLREKSDLGLFHFKKKFEVNENIGSNIFYPEVSLTWSIFKESNLHTLLNFFTSCMHRKKLDVLHLTSLPNHCMCRVCFNQIYSTHFRTDYYVSQWQIFSPQHEHNYAADYPNRYCFMHDYILNQRILCYDRYIFTQFEDSSPAKSNTEYTQSIESEDSSPAQSNREDTIPMDSQSLISRKTSSTCDNMFCPFTCTCHENEIQEIAKASIAPLEENMGAIKIENRTLRERLHASSQAQSNIEDTIPMDSQSLSSWSTSSTCISIFCPCPTRCTCSVNKVQEIVMAIIAPLEENMEAIKADIESLKMENKINQRIVCYDRYIYTQFEDSFPTQSNTEDTPSMDSQSLSSRKSSSTCCNSFCPITCKCYENEIQEIVKVIIAPLEEKMEAIKADTQSLKMENRTLREKLNARDFNNF